MPKNGGDPHINTFQKTVSAATMEGFTEVMCHACQQ
jgi:hypothetical protein